jgi:TolB protein
MPGMTDTRRCRSSSWLAVRFWRVISRLAGAALIVATLLGYEVAYGVSPLLSQVGQGEGRIAFSAYRHHNWDIYTVNPDGSDLRRVTHDPAPDRSPVWSPDGTKIAFASRRNHNWDIYVVDASGGEPRRLTTHPAYDGAPSFSPDGGRIAFESYQGGDLDIWIMDADGSYPQNLTSEVTEGDFGPTWSPDGRFITFTSWRYGDKDVFLVEVGSGQVARLTDSPAIEENPVWSSDNQKLAFVYQEDGARDIYVMDVAHPPSLGGRAKRLTWFTRDESPAWSPDGQHLAFIAHRFDGEVILSIEPDALGELPLALTGLETLAGNLAWNGMAAAWGEISAGEDDGQPPYAEIATPHEGRDPPYDFIRLPSAFLESKELGGVTKLSDRVDESFNSLQARVWEETGYDFLGTISEAFRHIAFANDASAYGSWHKAGRAFDTLFDFHDAAGESLLEVVREDMSGETYWRLYLRCARQDGSQGEPIKVNPWDFSYQARAVENPGEGGKLKPIPNGYYVDLTALAWEYGWDRISAHHEEDFHWTWHFKAVEFWHYEKRAGLGWYEAMLEVYPHQKVEEIFTWEKFMEADEEPYNAFVKGVPLPPEERRWLKVRR